MFLFPSGKSTTVLQLCPFWTYFHQLFGCWEHFRKQIRVFDGNNIDNIAIGLWSGKQQQQKQKQTDCFSNVSGRWDDPVEDEFRG